MLQIVLTMPEALASEIRWLSDQDGRPEAEIIREALGSYLAQQRIARHHLSDVGSNRPCEVTENDQYLADLAESYR
jgi:hypothetical protein